MVGPTVMMLPLITGDMDDGKMNQTPLLVGAAISLAGVAVWLVSRSFAGRANDESATAFETYDSGLQRKLNLCASEGRVHDCE